VIRHQRLELMVYFTAGPTQGIGGLFGYLTAVSTELTEGNAQ